MTASDWGPDSPATVERDDADSVPSVAAPARTPVPADTEERDGRETLSGDHSGSPVWSAIQALAALLEPDAFDPGVKASPAWRERAKGDALAYAAKAITAGYRLVSDDEATVDRVAKALHDRHCDAEEDGPCRRFDLHREWHIATARVAVEALRDGGVDRG